MKLLYTLLLSLLVLLFPQNIFAQESWVINEFNSHIDIQSDGVVHVVETIRVDFGSQEKHGIYRDIPISYEDKNGEKIYTDIDVDVVYQKEVGKVAEYKLTYSDEYLRIRIGNPDKTISGKERYTIVYDVKGVLRSFADYDELYWNVTGNAWEVPIQKASATILTPKEGISQIECYAGFLGARDSCVSSHTVKIAKFENDRVLMPGEGLTVVVGYTKGMVPILTIARPKTFGEKLLSIESGMLFSFAFLASLVGVVLVWWRNGRDFWFSKRQLFDPDAKEEVRPIGAHEPIIVEYTPPENLRPAEIGVLMDERADTLDITATIIDLATRGYMTIKEVPKKWLFGAVDYELSSTTKSVEKLIGYEQELYKSLFSGRKMVTASDLKTTFYKELAQVKQKLYEDGMSKKLFAANPETTRSKYLAGGIVLVVFSGILLISGLTGENEYMTSGGAGFLTAGVLLMIFSQHMPRRSAHGREMYRRILGYRMFIERVEKYRQPFFERQNLFSEVLPYAIVFGVAEKFAQQLKDMGVKVQNPSWYHSTTSFNPVLFSSNINNFSTSMSSAIASAPQSSGFSSGGGGGGSSGGGFGGGGGGSW